jgi:hypothetical protein
MTTSDACFSRAFRRSAEPRSTLWLVRAAAPCNKRVRRDGRFIERICFNNANGLTILFTVAAGITSISAQFMFATEEFPTQIVTDIFGFFLME